MSSQFNYLYGDQIHFPYSIASLIAYVKSKPELSSNFIFEKTFIFREKINDYIKSAKMAMKELSILIHSQMLQALIQFKSVKQT